MSASSLDDKRDALLREIMSIHADPSSADYNECDTAPCKWCSDAKAVLTASAIRDIRQQLEVEADATTLRISIGVEILAWALQNGCHEWPEEVKITDPATFAKEVASQLNKEAEDGTTPVHRMLDTAALAAIEYGAEGVTEPPL